MLSGRVPSGAWIGPWLAGPLLLTALFQGSTGLTERLALEKYPAYRDYQRTTPRLVPLPRWLRGHLRD